MDGPEPMSAGGRSSDNYPGITIEIMVRIPLSPEQLSRGVKLGELLRATRGQRTMTDVASQAGISVETLRKIETGRIPTPAFFTVSALCRALRLSLDDVAGAVSGDARHADAS